MDTLATAQLSDVDVCSCPRCLADGSGITERECADSGSALTLSPKQAVHVDVARSAVAALSAMISADALTADDLKLAALDLERAGCALRRLAQKLGAV